MKSARPTEVKASAVEPRRNAITGSMFAGTDNPRHLRALQALRVRALPRQSLDAVAGCSNGPELVAELRRRGLDLPCTRIDAVDRDGRPCKPGVYHLSDADRRRLSKWLRLRQSGEIDAGLAGRLFLLAVTAMMWMYGWLA